METNFTLLILFSILPIINKYLFWFYVIQLKEYRLDRFREYISTLQWKKAILNFWAYIEIPVFIIVLGYYLNPLLENTIYSVVVSLLFLETIFVISKIVKKHLFFPKITSRFLLTFFIFIFVEIVFFLLCKNIFLFILINLVLPFLFIFLSVFISLPLVNKIKKKKLLEAKLRSKITTNPIKIGITWSYWKSSVKEYLSQILEQNHKVLKTPKNINTELWISDLIIKKLKNKFDYFVVEMWAYKIWEIETLWDIVNHKYGFLTAIWNQHLALFWWIKNTIKGKSEIAKKVLENKWILYINWDDKNIRKANFNKKLNIVKYGIKDNCDAKSDIIEVKKMITKFDFYYKWSKTTFKTNLIWTHNIINITWILAFCFDIWLDKDELKSILLNIKMPENTLCIEKHKDIIFIDDTYNLSEWWLYAWLEALSYFKDVNRKILVLDDILELWKKSGKIHFDIWKKIWKNKLVDKVFYVWINNKDDFIKWLVAWWFKVSNIIWDLDWIKSGDIILFEWRKSGIQLNKILWKK